MNNHKYFDEQKYIRKSMYKNEQLDEYNVSTLSAL